jgi:hypothetical protein
LVEEFLDVVHPFLSAQITFQVMAGAFLSTSHEDAIRSPLEGSQDVEDIQLARAGQPDDLDVGRILQAH